MTEIFRTETDSDGVAVLTWDLPGRSMNVMTLDGLQQLSDAVDRLLADDAVKGIVLTSAKPDFAGGMDLNVLATMKDEAGDDPARGLFDGVMRMHDLLRRIELAGMDRKTGKGGKPIVWASPGTAAGIGLELGLACHRRIAAENPKAKIGLPEIMVGLFPGAGGTTRVARMLGAMAAAPFLLEGRMVDPQRAKSAGLIDEVVPADELLARAKAWVLEARDADLVKPWDRKGYKFPGGAPYHPAGFQTFVGANAMVHGRTQGVYPAAKALLAAVYEGAMVDFDTATRIEARWFVNVLMNPSSAAMVRSLFVNKEALEKGAVRPAEVPDARVKKLGVLGGGGFMGAGIGYVAANAGIEVVLLDRDEESAKKGVQHVDDILSDGVKKKRMTEEKKAETLSRVTATDDYTALQGCDLVIEAVFEDPGVKKTVTEAAAQHMPADAIFASNTSTLPITDLANNFPDAGRFIGIHFFSPVHKMMLVEIIKGENTDDPAVAKALDFVRQIRKTPIVVNDARFFYANRCIIPYINEGVRMLTEGVEPALIENCAKRMGMPLGPLQLTDETALDLGQKIAKATRAALGDAYPDTPSDAVLDWMVAEGRLGRKANAGFYAYDDDGRRQGIWPGLREKYPPRDDQPDAAEVEHRLMMAQALEAARALEEGVLMDVREGDVGAILGWGFAPWSGGPLSWFDMLGAEAVVAICDGLAERHGDRFAPPKLLREMARNGETFYGRFAPAEPAAA